jgi:membrane associated rhomboid family serine protease
MTDEHSEPRIRKAEARQPIFLLPKVVTGLVVVMVLIHMASEWVLSEDALSMMTLWLGFIPYRWLASGDEFLPYAGILRETGGALPLTWSLFTHAFLHASWDHLLLNMAWLVIFATPVARRYGGIKFIVIFLLTSAAGALAFATTTWSELQVLIGASGGVAGLTGVATRFMFQPVIYRENPETGRRIVLGRHLGSLRDMLLDGRPRAFIIIWVLINAAAPVLPMLTGTGDLMIAWQAHLGGFFAGLLMAPLFERVT